MNNVNLVDKIKKTEYQIDWEGHFSHLHLTLAGEGYFNPMRDVFGVSINSYFTVYRNGIVSAYLPTEEYEAFGKKLAEKVNDQEFFDSWLKRFYEITDGIRKAIEVDVDEYMQNIDKLIDLYDIYTTFQVATKTVSNFLPTDTSKEIFEKLESARRYSEDFYHKADEKLSEVLQKISEKIPGYTKDELSMLSIEELNNYLLNGKLIDKNILAERFKYSATYWESGKFTLLNSSEVDEIYQVWNSTSSDGSVSGKVAYAGKVTGVCRIIKDFRTVALSEGEILVTGMTDPNFVPLMKKAAAFVTDGGGLLCHAAIVAREMKKPCVIGTKNATKVFKDGDMVEVDADKGIVRKI